jgi:hypothetical protein
VARWSIPPPLDVGFVFRDPLSARISQRVLDDGRLETVVAHAPMPAVTPEMCLWFLENVDREVEVRGRRAVAYRFWHPRDHIHFQRVGNGDIWHIVEAFGADRAWLLDDRFHVAHIDEGGFTMEVRVPVLGAAATMVERWQPDPEGMLWTATLTAGFPGRRWLNAAVRRHRGRFIERWTRHNVEEGGCLPQFLPELYGRLAPKGRTGNPSLI